MAEVSGTQAAADTETRDKLMSQIRLVSQTLFAQEAVKQLREGDFALDSKSRITIKWEECMLVLFYVNNNESNKLAEVWSIAAHQITGPVFAACNLIVERKVAEAFTKLNSENSPLHWAALSSLPFILVYQNGWPVAFYNGERAVQPIVDYALTLACKGNYREDYQIAGGITVKENYEMGGYTQYYPPRTSSSQYTVVKPANDLGGPVRQFNAETPVVLVNSPAAPVPGGVVQGGLIQGGGLMQGEIAEGAVATPVR